MEICSAEKNKLIEELGLFFERRHQLPPLASRMYAIVVLSSDDGFSFDEMVNMTRASKSSVSTNLNLLIQLKFIDFYTKPGDRKRYFRSPGNFLKNMLNEHYDEISLELALLEKVNRFNRDHNPMQFKEKNVIRLIFQHYLEVQKANIEDTLKKINESQEN